MTRKITQSEMFEAMASRGKDTYSPYLWSDLALWLPFVRGKGTPRNFSGVDVEFSQGNIDWTSNHGIFPYTGYFNTSKYILCSTELALEECSSYCNFNADSVYSSSPICTLYGGTVQRRVLSTTNPIEQGKIQILDSDGTDTITVDTGVRVYTPETNHSICVQYFNSEKRVAYLDGKMVLEDSSLIGAFDILNFGLGHEQRYDTQFQGKLWDWRVYGRILHLSEIEEIQQEPWRAIVKRPVAVNMYHKETPPPTQSKFPLPLFSGAV